MRMRVQSLALLNGLRIRHCHELWHRSAATALIQPLAWELTYAAGAALKKQKKKKKKMPLGPSLIPYTKAASEETIHLNAGAETI